jgi:pimeloyl-ACP methyl ester carboxylesterase
MPFVRPAHRTWAIATGVTVLTLLISTGCRSGTNHSFRYCSLNSVATKSFTDIAPQHLEEARGCYARAKTLEAADSDASVDWYFAATRSAWLAGQFGEGSQRLENQAGAAYCDGLTSLLRTGQRFGRLDPASGLRVQQASNVTTIPVVHRGFAWRDSDFQQLSPPSKHLPSLLRTRYGQAGYGVPLVVTRWRDANSPVEARFYPPQTPFAATVVLKFSALDFGGDPSLPASVLEFSNPLQVTTTSDDEDVPLATDLTAPLAAVLEAAPRAYLAGFVQPGSQRDAARLAFLEPYQPGKIPVVLIHGLFSDPQSWADMINDLRASPGFTARFQIWTFRYPTGQGFLQSAAKLRGELQAAFQTCDPIGSDLALRQTVLIGHSMGGLIAKMQVTDSEDKLWRRIANRPLAEINIDDTTRARLAAACFFQPVCQVTRLIFIATPHQGSNSASGAIGKIASQLVETPPEDAAQHQQLIAQNPGVFADFVQTRLPTSVDLLQPNSPALEALREMRVSCRVKLHNIIGIHEPIGPSDGVVPVASAWHPDCLSEKTIASPHGKVHRAQQASAEVLSILGQHSAEACLDVAPARVP